MKTKPGSHVAWCCWSALLFTIGTAHADFDVAFTAAVEQKTAVAYNSQTDEFLVAYLIEYTDPSGTHYDVRCQLHNADGSKNGPAQAPFGQGTIQALGRPAIAYNPNQNIFLVVVGERVSTYDRVIGRFLDAGGTNRVGPDFFFDEPSVSPLYLPGNDGGALHVVYNSLLDEFVITVQREINKFDALGNPTRVTVLNGQRITESTAYPAVELANLGLSGSSRHAIAYAPVEGTVPFGGRYLFQHESYLLAIQPLRMLLLDSQLNLITSVPMKWGAPDKGERDADIAWGVVEGESRFLVVFSDMNNCAPYVTPPCPDPEDQWTGIWGSYVDPAITSYPVAPGNHAFPISFIPVHSVSTCGQRPQVSYSPYAEGFYVVWRECPGCELLDEERRSHIRGALVDYLEPEPVSKPVLLNKVISDCHGSIDCVPGAYWPVSLEDPELPDVVAMNGLAAAVVWQQHYVGNPSDLDVMGDLYMGSNTKPGPYVSINRRGHTVMFDTVLTEGFTAIREVSSGTPPPPTFLQGCSPPRYFDISTTATYSGNILICLSYDDTACDESMLKLLHYEHGAWVDVTTSLNTSANTICGTVTGLSEFLLAMPAPPLILELSVHKPGSYLRMKCNNLRIGLEYNIETSEDLRRWLKGSRFIATRPEHVEDIPINPEEGERLLFWRLRQLP